MQVQQQSTACPIHCAKPVILSSFEDLSYEEIAQILNLPISTRLVRAYTLLVKSCYSSSESTISYEAHHVFWQ